MHYEKKMIIFLILLSVCVDQNIHMNMNINVIVDGYMDNVIIKQAVNCKSRVGITIKRTYGRDIYCIVDIENYMIYIGVDSLERLDKSMISIILGQFQDSYVYMDTGGVGNRHVYVKNGSEITCYNYNYNYCDNSDHDLNIIYNMNSIRRCSSAKEITIISLLDEINLDDDDRFSRHVSRLLKMKNKTS